jgi:colicin import membrane protein
MLRDVLPGKGGFASGFGGSSGHRLKWWICFSGALHLVLILTLLVVPASTARRELPVPVYTVDLVAGSMPAPRPELRSPKRQEAKPAPPEPLPPLDEDPLDEVALEPAVPDPPKTVEAPKKVPPPPKAKEQVKKPPKKPPPPKKVKKAPEKPKKKVVKRKKPVKPKKVVKRKKPARKSPKKLVKKTSKAPKPKRKAGKDTQLVRRLKERRIGDALATAKERARLQREARAKQSAAGSGTAGGGLGRGGGIVRAMEFVIYRNEMLDRIKERWTWIGKRTDLEVTVGFGVNVDGAIFGLKLLKTSGDRSYDESVVRAVRRASPLPRPPARYAREFAEVELTFRPDSSDG